MDLGAHSLTQAELLAIIIGSGIPGTSALDIANQILDVYIGLYGIHQKKATAQDLSQIDGLAGAKAERILPAVKIGRLTYARSRIRRAEKAGLSPFYEAEARRLKEEVSGWDEMSLLSSVIGSGIKERSSRTIAEDVMKTFGGLEGLFGQDLGRFQKIKGLDTVKIIRIAAVLEIAVRLCKSFQT